MIRCLHMKVLGPHLQNEAILGQSKVGVAYSDGKIDGRWKALGGVKRGIPNSQS